MTAMGTVHVSFSRDTVAAVKTRALRRGVWYRALTRVERACMDLVIRVVDRVRSRLLAKAVSSVVRKLEAAMESRVYRLIAERGREFTVKVSRIARTWGHPSALCWVDDAGFKQYLIISYLNAGVLTAV